MANTIFFMHIPKTAGTSVRHSALAYFGNDRAMLLYGDGASSTSPALQERFHGTWRESDHATRVRLLSDFLVENDVPFFSSHMRMDRLPCFVPSRAFTIFREPVARVISHYHQYLKTHPKISLEEYIEIPKYQNIQRRTLGTTRLKSIGVVGLQDRYEETLQRVNAYFGINLQPARKNTAPILTQLKTRLVSRELMDRIARLNEKDMALYERAQKRFAEQTLDSCEGNKFAHHKYF